MAEDFIPAMQKLIDRDLPPEHIVIETSGLALPQPLVRAFNWPDIRTRVTVDGVVTVVDGMALAEGRFAADEAAVEARRAGTRCSTTRRRCRSCSRTSSPAPTWCW